MNLDNFTISEFLGIVLFGFPFFIYFTFVLFEGISSIINFFRFSDRRWRV